MNRTKKLLLMAVVLLFTTTAFAQSAKISKGWNNFYTEYNYMDVSWVYPADLDKDDIWDFEKEMDLLDMPTHLNGFSFGYSRTISLSPAIPLYLEVGGAMQLGLYHFSYTNSEKERWYKYENEYNENITLFSLKCPVNVLYHFDIPHTPLAIEPFSGFYFRGIVLGIDSYKDTETKYENEGDSDRPKWEYSSAEVAEETLDIFDKKDVESPANRLQFGMQLGANVALFNRFYFGMSTAVDLNTVQKDYDTRFNTFSMTAGVRF